MGDKQPKLKTAKAVRKALDRIEQIDQIIDDIRAEKFLDDWEQERAELEAQVKEYALLKEDYEDDEYKVTRVVSKKRYWDGSKLERLVPKGLFLRCVSYTPSPEKIDALVKEGKLDLAKIKPAFIEEPNKPYAKLTKKSQSSNAGEDEADSLAAKLK